MRGGYGRWSGLTEDEKRNPIETDKLPPIVSRRLIRGIRERTDAAGHVHVEPSETEIEAAVDEPARRGRGGARRHPPVVVRQPEGRASRRAGRPAPGAGSLPHALARDRSDRRRVRADRRRSHSTRASGPIVGRYLDNLRRALQQDGLRRGPARDAGVRRPAARSSARPRDAGRDDRVGPGQRARRLAAASAACSASTTSSPPTWAARRSRSATVRRGADRLPARVDGPPLPLRAAQARRRLARACGRQRRSRSTRAPASPRIGPRSAGSYPGPVCYDHGGEEPTITDSTRSSATSIRTSSSAAGSSSTSTQAARVFEEKVAKPLGLPLLEAAAAVYRLANSLFFDLLHKTTVQRGLDPRELRPLLVRRHGGDARLRLRRGARRLATSSSRTRPRCTERSA